MSSYSSSIVTYHLQGGPKKVSQIIFAITLSIVIQCSYFLAHIHYRKFATGGCIVSPTNVVRVTTLPCKILTTTFFTLNSIHCCKKSSFYFGSNNCQFLWNNFLKEPYRMNITSFQVTGTPLRPCDHCYGSRLRN